MIKHTFLRNKYFDYFVDFLNGLPLNVARSLQKVLKQFFSSEMTFAGFPLLPPSLFTRLPCASVPASSQRHVLLIPKQISQHFFSIFPHLHFTQYTGSFHYAINICAPGKHNNLLHKMDQCERGLSQPRSSWPAGGPDGQSAFVPYLAIYSPLLSCNVLTYLLMEKYLKLTRIEPGRCL